MLRIPVGDYAAYRRKQNAGNAAKIDTIFVKEANIARLAAYIDHRLGAAPRILCHGSRNGAEMRYFKNALPEATVLGTDIADSASNFPDTVQWDFHDLNPEWVGGWDVIYSNSWDHAFEPERAFKNWLQTLSGNGVLLLEHTRKHNPEFATELDPFGATVSALTMLLNGVGSPQWGVVEVLSDFPDRSRDEAVVVVAALAEDVGAFEGGADKLGEN
jgi:SAM-dependent methyltransferase